MAISYKKLFKLLIDRDLKKKDLRDMTGVSYATLQKLERGENVMTDVLNTICLALGCDLHDIAEIIPEERGRAATSKADEHKTAGGAGR